jgi:hypothetical protein
MESFLAGLVCGMVVAGCTIVVQGTKLQPDLMSIRKLNQYHWTSEFTVGLTTHSVNIHAQSVPAEVYIGTLGTCQQISADGT